MWQVALDLAREDLAVSSVEYAFLLAIVGAGILAAVVGLGEHIATRMNTAATTIQTP